MTRNEAQARADHYATRAKNARADAERLAAVFGWGDGVVARQEDDAHKNELEAAYYDWLASMDPTARAAALLRAYADA
jgi:hypothetical protein